MAEERELNAKEAQSLNTIMKAMVSHGPAYIEQQARGGKGNIAEAVKIFTGGKIELLTDLINVVKTAMPLFQQGTEFMKEGDGNCIHMRKYFQVNAGALYFRSGSTVDRLAATQDRLNNNKLAVELAAKRAAPNYNVTDFFDLDDIFDFSLDQRKIFRAPENFKWSKTTGSIKKDVTNYIMDSLCFYAECMYLSAKNLLKYYPRLFKDKVDTIKRKAEQFKTSVKSKERWKNAIKKNDVNLLFADPALESNMAKRENDEEYNKERLKMLQEAMEAALEEKKKIDSNSGESGNSGSADETD